MNRLPPQWKKGALKILYFVARFIIILRYRADRIKRQALTPQIYSVINDFSSDFDYLRKYGLFRRWKGEAKTNRHIDEQYQQRRIETQLPVLMPESLLVNIWDALLLVITAANLCYIPLRLGFPVENGKFIFITDIALQFIPWLVNDYNKWKFYMLDIVLIFNKAYYDKGSLHVDRKQIQRNYMNRNFYGDLIVLSIYPFSIILKPILLAVWIGRIGQISTRVKGLEQSTPLKQKYNVRWQLFKLVCQIIFVVHFVACAWRYLAVCEDYYTLGSSWVSIKGLYDNHWSKQYVWSFYWSMITLTTIGYGDVAPVNEYEMIFVVITVPISLILFGYALSSIQSIFSDQRQISDKLNSQMSIINRYIRKNKIDHQLSMKIRNYFDCYLKNMHNTSNEASKLIDSLNPDLKIQVNEHVYKQILMKSDLISRTFNDVCIKQLCQVVKVNKYIPGDTITKQDATLNSLVFIISGEVQLSVSRSAQSDKSIQLMRLHTNETIGEQQFINQTSAEFSSKAIEFTETVSLSYQDMITTIRSIPGQYEKFVMLRNNLQMDEDFKGFHKFCEICSENHSFRQCPCVFYKPIRSKLLLNDTQQQNRMDHHRTIQRAYGFRINRLDYQFQALSIALEMNQLKENDLTEEYLLSIGFRAPQKGENDQMIEELSQNDDSSSQSSATNEPMAKITLEVDSLPNQAIVSDDIHFEQLVEYTKHAARNKQKGIFEPLMEFRNRQQTKLRVREKTNTVKDLRLFDRILKIQEEEPHQNEEETIQDTQLESVRQEYLATMKSDSIENFDQAFDFQFYYPSKNLQRLIQKQAKHLPSQKTKRLLQDRFRFTKQG